LQVEFRKLPVFSDVDDSDADPHFTPILMTLLIEQRYSLIGQLILLIVEIVHLRVQLVQVQNEVPLLQEKKKGKKKRQQQPKNWKNKKIKLLKNSG
jgi:hypothetical protein